MRLEHCIERPLNAAHRQPCDPRQNQLIAALSDADLGSWAPHLEPVDLRAGQVLSESGCTSAHAYFPTTAIVSLLYRTQGGASAEVAVVGNDGVVGISLFMGGSATPSQAVVQAAGQAYRLNARAVREAVHRAGPALSTMLRYAQAMIAQVAQTAVCNRYHSIDQQLARRLLVGLDRSASDELVMTQEGVFQLLGVRREGVTAAALRLQEAGVIRYRRGRIAVLDRPQLEQQACECYAVAKKEYDRLLPAQSPAQLPALLPVQLPRPAVAQRNSLFTSQAADGPARADIAFRPERPAEPPPHGRASQSLTAAPHHHCTAPAHSGACCPMPA
jgi:CRP-like cAMP-binding protein